MSTCPNCLKKYKSLSRHLYSSSCITIKSKSNPKRKFVQKKHKTFGTNIIPNRAKPDFPSKRISKSVFDAKSIPFWNHSDGTDNESNSYSLFVDDNCNINTKSTQNEMK